MQVVENTFLFCTGPLPRGLLVESDNESATGQSAPERDSTICLRRQEVATTQRVTGLRELDGQALGTAQESPGRTFVTRTP